MAYYLNLSVLSNNLKDLPKRKQLSAEARRILSQLENRPITDEDIAREAGGRPFFPNREVRGSNTDFSISHSGALAAVSLVRGKNLRTGCDVELVRPRAGAGKIAEEFFTASERAYIGSGSGFDLARFYQIWTLKECFLKLRGLSVFDINSAPSFISREGLYTFGAVGVSPVLFNLYELTGNAGERYILATAVEPQPSGECREGSPLEGTDIEQPEIRWFSREHYLLAEKQTTIAFIPENLHTVLYVGRADT